MKKLLTFLSIIICSKFAFAQIWQQTYGVPGYPEIAVGVVSPYDNGFLIGINGNGSNILKADINGNILWTQKYKYLNNNYIGIRDIATYNDGTIFHGGVVFEDNYVYSFLIKTDKCGKFSWCKKITYNGENTVRFAEALADGDILWGTSGVSSDPLMDRYQLWEIDPDGNILWMKQVIPGTQYMFENTSFFQMCLTSDGGSLMSGYTYYPYDTLNSPWDAVLQPCLVKYDSLGDMQWVYPPLSGADTNRTGFFRGCTQIGDYYYAVGSDYGEQGNSLIPLVARFDVDGNLVNYKLFLPDTIYMQLSNVISATDTSILLISACSQVITDPNFLVVFLADSLGNFQKSFTRTDLIVSQFGDEVAKMRDNKFLIPCSFPIGGLGANSDIVAIKLNANLEYDSIYTQTFTYDSLCPYPIVSDTIICNCEPFVSVQEAESTTGSLKIYPNPATDHFIIDYGQEKPGGGDLWIYNVYGRLIFREELPPGKSQSVINCKHWKPGLYFARLESGGKPVSGKVIVK